MAAPTDANRQYYHALMGSSAAAAVLTTVVAAASRLLRAVQATRGWKRPRRGGWREALEASMSIPVLFELLLWGVAGTYWFLAILTLATGPYPAVPQWVLASIYASPGNITPFSTACYWFYWFTFCFLSEGMTIFLLQRDTSTASLAISAGVTTVVAGVGATITTVGFTRPYGEARAWDAAFNSWCACVHGFALCTQALPLPTLRQRFRHTVLWIAAFGFGWRLVYVALSVHALFSSGGGLTVLLLRCVGVPTCVYIAFLADIRYWNAKANAMARPVSAPHATSVVVGDDGGGRQPLLSAEGGGATDVMGVGDGGGNAVDGRRASTDPPRPRPSTPGHTRHPSPMFPSLLGSPFTITATTTTSAWLGDEPDRSTPLHCIPEDWPLTASFSHGDMNRVDMLIPALTAPVIASVMQPPPSLLATLLCGCCMPRTDEVQLQRHVRQRYDVYRRELTGRGAQLWRRGGLDIEIPESEVSVVMHPIAAGSYGEVCAGRWRGTPVAIKTFHQDTLSSNADAFDRERTALLSLRDEDNRNHPGIVGYLGYCVCLDRISLILELCEYGSLDVVLVRCASMNPSPLTLLRRFRIVCDVTATLSYIHDRCNHIHRDLKPMNLLITRDFHCKIADLGEARRVAMLMTAGVGSPMFRAPETFATTSTLNRYDAAADMYALGLIIWCVFHDDPEPYHGFTTESSLARAIFKGHRPTIHPSVAAACPGLEPLLTSLWHADPRARPTAASTLRRLEALCYDVLRLGAATSTTPTHSLAASPPPRLTPSARSHDVAAGGGAAGAGVYGGGRDARPDLMPFDGNGSDDGGGSGALLVSHLSGPESTDLSLTM